MKKEKTIKALLAELFLLTKKESFLDAKLSDGSIIRTDDDTFKTGSKVSLISEDGSVTPVVDGDYTLEDGSKITCKAGVIESIVPPTPTTTPDASTADATGVNPVIDAPAVMTDATAPVMAPVETPAVESTEDSDMATLIEIIKNLTDRVSALEEKISSTNMAVEKMSSAPAAKPFTSTAKGTVGDYLEAYRNEHKAKTKAASDRILTFFTDKPAKETPLVFTKTTGPVAESKPVNKKDIDLGFGKSFSISN